MAIAKFTGIVKGYSEDENGDIHLAVEELDPSNDAIIDVQQMTKGFNPQSSVHGFGARDIQCKVRPGFANYHFTLNAGEARGIQPHSRVVVDVEFYHVRKVVLANKRWAAIPEVRHRLVSLRLDGGNQHKLVKSDADLQPTTGKAGKSDK